MGANFLSAMFKHVDLTEQRMLELHAVIDGMTAADILSQKQPTDLATWQSQLREYLHILRDAPDDTTDVEATADCRYLITAGSSWGDAPTEAYSAFDTLSCIPPIMALIDRYFVEDYPDEAPSTMSSPTGEAVVRLKDGKSIRSGWIDKDDPDALPAGDYLAVDDKNGEQLFYVDSADLFADPVAGRKLLLQLLQACM